MITPNVFLNFKVLEDVRSYVCGYKCWREPCASYHHHGKTTTSLDPFVHAKIDSPKITVRHVWKADAALLFAARSPLHVTCLLLQKAQALPDALTNEVLACKLFEWADVGYFRAQGLGFIWLFKAGFTWFRVISTSTP